MANSKQRTAPGRGAELDLEELLIADLNQFGDSFWRNEEIGEKRVNFFLTLATGVIVALVALFELASETGTEKPIVEPQDARTIALFALGALLIVGVITLFRMIRRNCVTDQYKEAMNHVRAQFDAKARSGYEPFPDVKEPRLITGGLTDFVAAINGAVLAVLFYFWNLALGAGDSPLKVDAALAWTAALLGVVVIVAQIWWAKRTRRAFRARLKKAFGMPGD